MTTATTSICPACGSGLLASGACATCPPEPETRSRTYPPRTAPVFATLADDDHAIGWLRIGAFALAVTLGVQVVIWTIRSTRPVTHIDAALVAEAPIERFTNVKPDELNAMGLARDIAERMFRASESTAAQDAEFLLNHMVPELQAAFEKNLVEGIEKARRLHVYYGGHYAVTVRNVTPIKADLPPFVVEVSVRVEPKGLHAPGGGEVPKELLRGRDLRVRLTLVPTTKSVTNRDALLVQYLRTIDEGDQEMPS